ncbi:large subunit ribosomal protein L32 protein [Dioscorea alata]|uniref:Large subunit ribosomal protein L32 protein n=1 Tax=Dioscorea alata TaxID=55571 RepID=A0ACB7U830_DIOAL|nr:large subunit ribosomal protein L32 protein [Dioscorea alata]
MAASSSSLLRRISSQILQRRPMLPIYSSSLDNRPFPFEAGGSSAAPSLPGFSSGAVMDLMAVPKKKVSRFKKGLRNGPKALKPIPVIVRCKACGRVKLPHFFCCSGDRGSSGSSDA